MPVLSPPIIPDHEMLRVIGRGAYGEIWLARSLTGALRAVKVVHRSTFEDERAFNREFSGMSRFEPFSREQDGFVDILHVGRGAEFFYYIMELADDCATGPQIDPVRYKPRTLKTELQSRGRLPVEECMEIGQRLSEALEALHVQGLAHRDIKPANIIFVGGAPKLADIGLVAATGQQSFVGTEGYVPPEGPGSPQGDIYSLGKVLYEISTGKDRLDFPSINTDLTRRSDKEALLRLNSVLLKACANDPASRYRSAAEMLADLQRVQQGGAVKRPWRMAPLIAMGVLLLSATIFIGTRLIKETPILVGPVRGEVTIKTEPSGALVIIGDRMARSPAVFNDIGPGRHPVRVMMSGFDPIEADVEVQPNRRADLGTLTLTRSTGSLHLTSDPPDTDFELRDASDAQRKIIRSGKTPATVHNLFTGRYEIALQQGDRKRQETVEIKRGETTAKSFEFANGTLIVSSEPPGAAISIDGKPGGQTPLRVELPSGSHTLVATYRDWLAEERSVTIENHREVTAHFVFGYGSVKITSAPGGATVIRDGVEIGVTPLLLEEVKPGEVQFELHLVGCKPAVLRGSVQPHKQAFLAARLERNLGPEPGQPWKNSLGMRFIPIGNVRMCVWETRVKDYAAYCRAARATVEHPDFAQNDEHPVVKVNWYDAQAFCKWLTEKERAANLLEDGQRYRLLTDLEWSIAAGLPDEAGTTPEERDGKIRDTFPWGKQWPPPAGAGNYADQSSTKRPRARFIENYNDGFPQTSRAGSFAPNPNGLYDIGGNVWEWCEEGYKGGAKDWGVLRGGSWANSSRSELQSSYRNVVDRSERDVIYGFRCVLASEPAQ